MLYSHFCSLHIQRTVSDLETAFIYTSCHSVVYDGKCFFDCRSYVHELKRPDDPERDDFRLGTFCNDKSNYKCVVRWFLFCEVKGTLCLYLKVYSIIQTELKLGQNLATHQS